MPSYKPSRAKLAVLTQLSLRPMTVSEMGRRLTIDKAAAYRHLRVLVKAGLVERLTSNRKWVYYKLSADRQESPAGAELGLLPANGGAEAAS